MAGKLLYAGPRSELTQSRESLTARYLNGELRIPVPSLRHKPMGPVFFANLWRPRPTICRNIDLMIPLGMLVAVTGCVGLGQVHRRARCSLQSHRSAQRWRPHSRNCAIESRGDHNLQGIVLVDQSPIGRTPRVESLDLFEGV